MARRSAKHVVKRTRHKLTGPFIAGIVLLLTVFSGLALAESEGEGTSSTALPIGSTAQELVDLTKDGDQVSTEPLTDPEAAETLPQTDLARDEAEELLTSVFPSVLEEQAGVYGDLEVDAFRSDYVAVVPPPDPGKAPGLLSSLLPLRTEAESGAKEVVDLDLERDGADLEPANPLVDLKIPATSDEAIKLPDVGLGIGLDAAATRSASIVTDGAAFYPNVAEESDFAVVAIPTGVEILSQLRSPEAPTSQTYTLDLPQGAQLEETEDGGAVVKRAGDSLVIVRPPSALDANGESVPVSMTVTGSTLSLNVSPASESVFPILVDPVFENYAWMNNNNNTGIYTDWREYTSDEAHLKPSWIGVWNSTMHAGLNLRAYSGPVASGSSANWNYYVPRYFTDKENPLVNERPTTYIRNMTLSQVYFQIEEGSPIHSHPFMIVGLWDENKGAFASAGFHYSNEGAYNGVSINVPNPGEYTDVKNGGIALATYESMSYPRQAFVGNAWVEITDKDNPGFAEISSVPEWVNTKAGTPIKYKVTDPGLGIHNLRLEYPRANGGISSPITGIGCTGNASNPCPRTVSNATKPIAYYPDLMAQGEDWVKVIAQDATSHFSEPALTRIKVDHDKPTIDLSGNLTEQASVGTALAKYTLNYTARDGDDAAAVALTPVGSSAQLSRPMGVTVDQSGNTFVVDRSNNKIIKYKANGSFDFQFGSAGSADGQFNDPRGIAIAPDGTIWVADMGNDRIQAFSPSGTFLRKGKFTDPASEPYAITTGPGGVVWVTDIGLHRIVKVSENPISTLLISTGGGGTSLSSPVGATTDEFGNVWVADNALNKILEFDSAGNLLFQFGSPGSGPGQLSGPVGIDIAPSGNVGVVDRLNNRVQIFKPDGSVLRQFGTGGSSSNQLSEPAGFTFGSNNMALVADSANLRIARWEHADQDPQSGAAKVEVKVDDTVKATNNPGCTPKNCVINGSWTMNADEYSVGTHKVVVLATDGVSLVGEKELQVETHGDRTPPTVSLSGSITEQAALGKTLPTYKVNVSAADPGPTGERKSGVTSIGIKVDGKSVDSITQACPAEGCSLAREWTLTSSSYSAGPHNLEVTATDSAGKSTTAKRAFEIARDVTAPDLSLSGALPGAPEGWVQQGTRSATADATDKGGYGVKQIRFSIDGVVVGESLTQACEVGGCPKSKTFWIDMTTYDGGAHPAAMIAEDLAGNIRKKSWTINVDPEGHISASEAEDTLEALDATSSVNTIGESESEAAYEGTSPDLTLKPAGVGFKAVGSAAPTSVSATPGGFTVEVPSASQWPNCPERPAEEAEAPLTGVQEEQLAETVTCSQSPLQPVESRLIPAVVTPSTNISGASQTLSANGASAIAGNVASNVDLITRPLFDGAMTFTAIRDATGPDSFSWKVSLDIDQTLELVNPTTARVRYAAGPVAFSIIVAPAHDAVGTTVPTHLSVQGNIVTLSVEHRTSSYTYPVVGGAGWEGGFETFQIQMPSGEEAGEIFEGVVDEGDYKYVETTIGPPEAATAVPAALASNGAPKKKRAYNFHQCDFEVSGSDGDVPGDGVRRREEVIEHCHGETEEGINGGYYTVNWGVAVHGWYEYQPHDFVWLSIDPKCKKWGSKQPAKVHCWPQDKVGQLFNKLNVIGDYRFPSGKYNGGYAPYCLRVNGVLPSYWVRQEGESKTEGIVLEDTIHFYDSPVGFNDSCDFDHLS